MTECKLDDKLLGCFSFKITLDLGKVIKAESSVFELIQDLLVVLVSGRIKVRAQLSIRANVARQLRVGD